jgi:hypothetical protein
VKTKLAAGFALVLAMIAVTAGPAFAQAGDDVGGFDLKSAVVLGLVLTGLVTQVVKLVSGDNRERLKVVACLGVAIVAVQLVAASDFASTEIVLERPLNSLNFASQLVVAILAAGVASLTWEIVKRIDGIGENRPGAGT